MAREEQNIMEDVFDVDGYLKRIGMEWPVRADRKTLDQLMLAQQSYIPYENLSVYFDYEPIGLQPGDLYQKLVVRKRGGYCFELNGIFYEALIRLGFPAYSCFCRVQRGRKQRGAMRHRGVIVEFPEGPVFCDVGYGSVLCPRSLDLVLDKKQHVRDAVYWFEDAGQGWWNLHYQPGPVILEDGTVEQKEEQVEVMVSQSAGEIEDYEPLNDAVWKAPNSVFKRHRRCHLLTQNGGMACMDGELSILDNGRRRLIQAVDEADERRMLQEWFGLPADELEEMYARRRGE